MSLTNIDIASRALTRLGADTITSFTDGSREAEVMNQLYTHTYETILTEAKWNVATKDIELSRDATAPTDPNFVYRFILPSDYLNLINFYGVGGVIDQLYTVQDGYVLNSQTRLFAKYIYKPNETDLPAWFVNYLVVRLALSAAEALIGIGSVQTRLEAEAQDARLVAFKQDNAEQPLRDALSPSRYVTVRL